ncbi:MAG: hypothetical protein K6G63_01060 [Eubacterium sp.]|nr:hypothetical protein [Eubacterium sp.]
MKHLVKTCFTFVFALVLVFSNLLIAQAETIGNGHVLKAINNPKSKVECSITNTGTAKVSAVVKTVFCSTTKMTLYFQKYSKSKKKWTTIKTCTKTSSRATTILESTYELSKKGTYRVKMTAVVTRNKKTETIRMISNNAKF